MQATIIFPFTDQPHGGGNQFLKLLKKWLLKQGVWVDDPLRADIALINSHHAVDQILHIANQRPELPLVHRIDGPVSLVRDGSKTVDNLIFAINKHLASGTVFQSAWSESENRRLGLKPTPPYAIVSNTPDPEIFYKKTSDVPSNSKIQLVASSWSDGPFKGFETHQWLDEHLDFSKYDFTFVGNSRIEFKNARHIQPLKSVDLANELRKHDIYIFPSKREPRSNALLEAMGCGLPVIAFDGASNPESVKQAGKYFSHPQEIPSLIENMMANYADYQSKIEIPSIDEIGERYLNIFEEVLQQSNRKKAKKWQVAYIKSLLFQYKINGYIRSKIRNFLA